MAWIILVGIICFLAGLGLGIYYMTISTAKIFIDSGMKISDRKIVALTEEEQQDILAKG